MPFANMYASVTCGVLVLLLASCNQVQLYRSTAADSGDSASKGKIINSSQEEEALVPEKLLPPENFTVVNNKTGTQKYLTLQWKSVPGASAYKIYCAVYPTGGYHLGSLPEKSYRLLAEVPAIPEKIFIRWNHHIPDIPLRRYAYCVASVNEREESPFSPAVHAWRFPIDEEEALLDIDYSIHFAQTAVPNFGKQGQESIVSGRASGNYYYASKMTKVMSKFENYSDFETVLNGNPVIKINFFPLGVRMSGDINVSGLYKAVVSYDNLVCVIGGYTRKGGVKIIYHHPEKGILEKTYEYDQARSLMKTVAYDASEVMPRPVAAEWDESDPQYLQRMRSGAGSLSR